MHKPSQIITNKVILGVNMEENRRAVRRRCFLGGRIQLQDRASRISCVVKSLSETGAKIEFEAYQLLPNSFDLLLDNGAKYSIKSIAWHRGNIIGVVFNTEPVVIEKAEFKSEFVKKFAVS